MDFISYCRTLSPDDWSKKVTKSWTVKDVVAHMVGWEKEAAKAFKPAWVKGIRPWFLDTSDFAEFNAESVKKYRHYSPVQLLEEWVKCQGTIDGLIEKVGKDNIAQRKDFEWVFDEGADSHYDYHLKQIQEVLKK